MIKVGFYCTIIFISIYFICSAIYWGDWLCIPLSLLPIIFSVLRLTQLWNEWMWGEWHNDETHHCNIYKLQNDATRSTTVYKPYETVGSAYSSYQQKVDDKQLNLVKENHHVELFEVIRENNNNEKEVTNTTSPKTIEPFKQTTTVVEPVKQEQVLHIPTKIDDEYNKVYNVIIDYLVTPNDKTKKYRSEAEVKAILELIKFVAITDKTVTLFVSNKFNELIIEAKISIGKIMSAIKDVEKDKTISFTTTSQKTITEFYNNGNTRK